VIDENTPDDRSNTADIFAGGSNGFGYLFRKNILVATCPALRGGVAAVAIFADKLFLVGAQQPVVKVSLPYYSEVIIKCLQLLDARSLAVLASLHVHHCLTGSMVLLF